MWRDWCKILYWSWHLFVWITPTPCLCIPVVDPEWKNIVVFCIYVAWNWPSHFTDINNCNIYSVHCFNVIVYYFTCLITCSHIPWSSYYIFLCLILLTLLPVYVTVSSKDPIEKLTLDNNLSALVVIMINTRSYLYWIFTVVVCLQILPRPYAYDRNL